MSESKTKPTAVNVDDFLAGIADQRKVEDSYTLIKMMSEVTGEPAVMWGPTMIGFGSMHYRTPSGCFGDMFLVGFSPRKASFSLYVTSDIETAAAELAVLGKYKAGKSCLYVKRLSDIDESVLRRMVESTVEASRQQILEEATAG